jgi:hypothetical protein
MNHIPFFTLVATLWFATGQVAAEVDDAIADFRPTKPIDFGRRRNSANST